MQKISFVIPCYRSEKTLAGVVTELQDKLKSMEDKYTYEVILVNDDSPDDTYGVIKTIAENTDNVLGISLARNFGQHAALMAGFHYVTGDIVVCLDDDGQTPAFEVDKLLDAVNAGADVAYARYAHKKHSFFRNFGSFVNEKMLQFLLKKPKELIVSSYFAAKRFVIDEVIKYDKSYPYMMGLVLRTTNRIVNVEVDHREREVGRSGYTLGKLLTLWMNGFTAFSVTPLRVSTWCGCIFAVFGFLYGIYTIIKHFVVGIAPWGYDSLMSMLSFIGGMILMMLGLTGEYIGRMYISMNNAPQYIIREMTQESADE
ncbi:MAG: glycosyltransferase family 2 protein [Lachnospiraceae bacterium]|nr:glycosyltransferase family 2 protein [Lachnospiraceae bacterium]